MTTDIAPIRVTLHAVLDAPGEGIGFEMRREIADLPELHLFVTLLAARLVPIAGPLFGKNTTNAEVSIPINSCQIDTSAPKCHSPGVGDQNTCGKCGASSRDTPQPKIAFLEGVYQCVKCYKASKATAPAEEPARPLPPETAPASSKAVPKPPAKVPAPVASGAVCAHCGKPISEAERTTSLLFMKELRCRTCIQTTDSNGKVRG